MTSRKPIIAGNWKMHKTVPEAVEKSLRQVRTSKWWFARLLPPWFR